MSKKIMVVDDDQTIRNTFAEVLAEEDYIVESFENGLQALESLSSTTHSRPDLIILDLNMPKMNGLDFLKSSKEVGKDIPVILLTASTTIIDVLELDRDIRIARKPIDFDLFVNIVKELLK